MLGVVVPVIRRLVLDAPAPDRPARRAHRLQQARVAVGAPLAPVVLGRIAEGVDGLAEGAEGRARRMREGQAQLPSSSMCSAETVANMA